jgi:hypothetical protein
VGVVCQDRRSAGHEWFFNGGSFIIFFFGFLIYYNKKHANNMQETGRYYAFVEYEDSEGAENALKVNCIRLYLNLLYMHTYKKKKRGAPIRFPKGKFGSTI